MNPQDQLKNLLTSSEIILKASKELEPAQTEVFASYSTELRAVFEGKDFSLSTSNTTSMYGIRSIVGGRPGFVTTNSNDPSVLKDAAKEAQLVAKMASPSEHHQIAPRPESFGHFESLDPKLVQMNPRDVCEYAERVVKEAFRDHRVAVDRAEFSWNLSAWSVMNSNDFTQSAISSTCGWFVMGMAKAHDEVTSFDYDGGNVIFRSEIESEIERSVGTFRDSVVSSLGSKKGRTYRGAVLLHPAAVMDLIGGFVSANANGIRHQDGMSSWKDKIGEKVASELLHVYEDPLDRKRPEGWMAFDREGVVTARHNIIQDGVLNFIAHNCFSAHRAGVAPTGNAHGGARSLPTLGFSNLSVGGSKKATTLFSDEELVKKLNSGLVLKRFSGNSDMTSGHFSGVAKNSWWVEGGHRSHPVTEVMVSGNLFELVRQIVAVGRIQHKMFGGGVAPYILVDGLSVTSA